MGTNVGKGHVFDDPEVKAEMLALRIKGCSLSEIALRYDVDHTTIVYHCKEAGIMVGAHIKKRILELRRKGETTEYISETLKVPGTVVDWYCFHYGARVTPKVPLAKLHLESVAPPHSKLPKPVLEKPERTVLTKTDERGVSWVLKDEGWVCAGKSQKEYTRDIATEKKKALELKRIAMLTY